MDGGSNLENEQVSIEGVEAGPEAPEANNATVGDGSADAPGPTLEEYYGELLESHHYAIQGMAAEMLEFRGRLTYVYDLAQEIMKEIKNAQSEG